MADVLRWKANEREANFGSVGRVDRIEGERIAVVIGWDADVSQVQRIPRNVFNSPFQAMRQSPAFAKYLPDFRKSDPNAASLPKGGEAGDVVTLRCAAAEWLYCIGAQNRSNVE